jgi:hypothetical protein
MRMSQLVYFREQGLYVKKFTLNSILDVPLLCDLVVREGLNECGVGLC